MVTATNPSVVGSFGKMARTCFARTRIIDTAWLPCETSRLIVSTAGRLGEGVVGFNGRDFWFALNPEHLFSSPGGYAIEALKRPFRGRMFGLMSLSVSLPPRTRSLLESLYGTDEMTVRRHGHRRREADVVFLPIEGGGNLAQPTRNAHELKRDGIWRNPVRNRRLARLIRQLAEGDTGTVRKEFPRLEAMTDEQLCGRTCVRVENLDQAEALLRWLPGLPLVASAPPAGTEGTFPHVTAARKRSAKGARLCLAVGDTKTDGPPFMLLIHADPSAAFSLPTPEDDQHIVPGRLLVIDFHDKQHPKLRQSSAVRKQAYAAAGWKVAGLPEPSPLGEFLARRPSADPEALDAMKRRTS